MPSSRFPFPKKETVQSRQRLLAGDGTQGFVEAPKQAPKPRHLGDYASEREAYARAREQKKRNFAVLDRDEAILAKEGVDIGGRSAKHRAAVSAASLSVASRPPR